VSDLTPSTLRSLHCFSSTKVSVYFLVQTHSQWSELSTFGATLNLLSWVDDRFQQQERKRERERERANKRRKQTDRLMQSFALALIQPEVLRYSRQTQICECVWFISCWWLMWVLCWKSEEQKKQLNCVFVPLFHEGTTVSADSWTAALGFTECAESFLTSAVSFQIHLMANSHFNVL